MNAFDQCRDQQPRYPPLMTCVDSRNDYVFAALLGAPGIDIHIRTAPAGPAGPGTLLSPFSHLSSLLYHLSSLLSPPISPVSSLLSDLSLLSPRSYLSSLSPLPLLESNALHHRVAFDSRNEGW